VPILIFKKEREEISEITILRLNFGQSTVNADNFVAISDSEREKPSLSILPNPVRITKQR
jgi:hypothetical protein